MTTLTKCCADCKQDLPPTAFVRDRQRLDGLSTYCRRCRGVRDAAYRGRVKQANRTASPPVSKRCCHCKQELPSSKFQVNTRSRDGLASVCKSCTAARRKARPPLGAAARAARNARQRVRRRERYATDPAYRDRIRAETRASGRRRRKQMSARQRERYQTDPVYRARVRATQQRWLERKRMQQRYAGDAGEEAPRQGAE